MFYILNEGLKGFCPLCVQTNVNKMDWNKHRSGWLSYDLCNIEDPPQRLKMHTVYSGSLTLIDDTQLSIELIFKLN